MPKRRIIIEGGSVAEERVSGVGNTAAHIIRTVASYPEIRDTFDLSLMTSFNKTQHTRQHNFPLDIHLKKLFIPGKVMNLATKLRSLPPMDLALGKGIYLFPNFKNWPLLHSPSITYIHDVSFMRHPEYVEEKNLHYLNAHIREFMSRSSTVVTVSHHAKKEIEALFPEYAHKVRVVYNGIDLDEMKDFSLSEQKKIADSYGLRHGQYFIFISNIEPRKNVDGLLRAYKLYCDTHDMKSKTQLLLVGGLGWKNEATLRMMKKLQKQGYAIVKPSRYVTDHDKFALISGSIGLVHPAFYEGFGLSPLEAMAYKKNVAVARNSSLPEVVGDCGIYMDANNDISIADSLNELYAIRKQENIKGYRRAQQFQWHTTLQPLKDIFLEYRDRI